jgi:hypothetical protein
MGVGGPILPQLHLAFQVFLALVLEAAGPFRDKVVVLAERAVSFTLNGWANHESSYLSN